MSARRKIKTRKLNITSKTQNTKHKTNNNINTKIRKVIPLISKYYMEDSFVNEKSLVKKLAKLLKPNQWLRVEPEPREYNKNMEYGQVIFMKPYGIWASKGEWHLPKDKYLTLLEVDYSKILVLTTKQDYIDFEKKYCIPEKISRIMKQDLQAMKFNNPPRYQKAINNLKNKKLSNELKKTVCYGDIDWVKVAKKYDGIAMIPNPRPYFPIDWSKYHSSYNHIWLKAYDVSSLVIWNQKTTTPITKYKSLGKISDIYKKAEKDGKKFDDTLLETIQHGL